MNTVFKLTLLAFGFLLAATVAPYSTKAKSNTAPIGGIEECGTGNGKCMVTASGVTIYGDCRCREVK